ncbi:MAG: glycosyltransferase family 39 protein [bacterium]|nr:glycosyltransferase family 39 protein [bacterium]
MGSRKVFLVSFLASVIFFLFSFFTLGDYNVSWDETLHFRRGQAYLYYFLTGKTNYNDLPQANLQGFAGDPQRISSPRRSFYQNDFHNGEYLLKNDSGHPPLNGELAALTNYIFYQKLGVLSDIASHHLFNIIASSLLVFVVVYFAAETMGLFAAGISFLALSTYPLFWAESHFNVKDPPETAFFAATIWAFWKSLQKGNIWWLLTSFLFFSLALGTKFNALFIPIILVPYLLIRYRQSLSLLHLKSIPRSYLAGLILGPLLVTAIFVGTWPFLWQDFPQNLFKIFGFYKDIGTGLRYQPDSFYILGFNTYPVQWIFYTTPPLVLLLTSLGVVFGWLNKKSRQIYVLCLLWLLIPAVRVTLPDTTIYGGSRQIMEFLPAMALFSGLGAKVASDWVRELLKSNKLNFKLATVSSKVILVLLFLWPIYILVKVHPNENVYFNSFIGGLPGARARDFPSWGNSFGNAYLAGINWLNTNAEKGAKLALIQGTRANAPDILLRGDIDYKNANWSGVERGGEYLMELTFNDTTRDFNYAWDYMETFLEPVYKLEVEGVPILKIWKNDLDHTTTEWKKEEVDYTGAVDVNRDRNEVVISLEKEVLVSSVSVSFQQKESCTFPKTSYVEISADKNIWVREKDTIPFPQIRQKNNIDSNQVNYYFAAKQAKYIRFMFDDENSCPLNYKIINVKIFN